jgi:hypothetical protein
MAQLRRLYDKPSVTEKSGWRFAVIAEQDEAKLAIDEMLDEIRGTAIVNMMEAQSYALREVKETLGFATADSKPSRTNEAPRFQTGGLMDSWKAGKPYWMKQFMKNDKPMVLRGSLYSWHPAAGILEWGGLKRMQKQRGRVWTNPVAPRPYYRTTMARIGERLARLLWGDL